MFFLISGYIIPASLERRGNVRRFWLGRFFRLYPLFIGIVVVVSVMYLVGIADLKPYIAQHPGLSLVGNVTMLEDLLRIPVWTDPMWTLSYEMIFYLLVTSLFVFGLHKLSCELSLFFAAIAVSLGGLMPKGLISDKFGIAPVAALALMFLVTGILAVSSGSRKLLWFGAVLLGGLAVSLLAANQRVGGWEGWFIIAAMFAGTAIYRIEQGQVDKRKGWGAVAIVGALGISVGAIQCRFWNWTSAQIYQFQKQWIITTTAVILTFAVGYLLRKKKSRDS